MAPVLILDWVNSCRGRMRRHDVSLSVVIDPLMNVIEDGL